MTHLTPDTRRAIVLLSFATFASMAAQRICDAMLPELARVFDTGLAQAAQVVSMFAMVYGVSQLFYGPLGDRLGKYRVIGWATLGCSVGSILAVVAPTLELLVAARMLVALGAAAIIPLSLAWIGDNVVYELRQATLARVGLGTTLGITGGQLFGGLLTDTLGWRWAFVFMTAVFGSVGWLLIRDWRRQQASRAAPGDVPLPAVRHGFVRQALLILTGRWSRIVLIVAFLEGAAGFGVLAIWAAHLHQAGGLSLTLAGAIVSLFGLGGMLYMALAGRVIRRLGEIRMVRLGVAGAGLAMGVISLWPQWAPTLLASPLAGFGFFMFHNTMQVNATQMAPAARGTGVSLFAAALFLGQSAGVGLAAVLVTRIGSAATIALGGVVLLLVGQLFALALQRRDALMA